MKFLGSLDIVILNHGTVTFGFWDGSVEDFKNLDSVMTVNFESHVLLASHALPHLRATNGKVAVISSLCGM